MKGNTLVAVYGSLRSGMHNNLLLSSSKLMGEDKVKGFTMLDWGSFPALIESDNTDDITIEVYSVDDPSFARLDRLEGYPSFYNRKIINTSHGEAWVYFIKEGNKGNYNIVESGDWVKYYSSRNNVRR